MESVLSDPALSSTVNAALSQRVSTTAVDPSSLVSVSAAEATTDRGISTMGHFSAAEMDFEARNWSAARDVFQYQRGHKDKKAMAEFLRQQESPQKAKASCIEASNRASKQYAPGLEGVLSKIEAFMQVGDVAMKAAPESVGLAWMGIRLCMHSVEDDFATFSLFSGAASDIIGILISCRVYGKMYGGDGGQKGLSDFQELHQKVVDYIPGIYTEIVDFSYQMSKQIGRNMGTRFLKGLLSSASNKFRSMIDGIRGMEKTMSEFAKKATDQLSIYYAEVGLEKQGAGLENQRSMMANIDVIKNTLNSNLEIQKLYVDQLKRVEEEKKNMKKKTPLDKAREKFDENAKLLKPTNFSEVAFRRNIDRKVEGTCQWIFELDEYKSWRTSTDNKLIWVSGVGGMGKSILLSNVIDRLHNELKDNAECSLQYFICSAGDDSTRLATRIKEQLLHQLYVLSMSQESADDLEKANELVVNYLTPAEATGGSQQKKRAASGFEDTYPSLARLLKKKIYLIIDALDECTDRKDSRFLRMLQDMLCLSDYPDFRFHIIICSRPEPDIENDLADKPVIKVEHHNGPDIEHAAKLKLDRLPGLSPAERALASEAIVKKAKGLFRCVEPAIEFLKKPLQRPLEKALEKLPDGLDNSYQQILRQTDPDYLALLKTALHWSILGQRKPTIAEIMDDYSCAYEQAEGSDENPYDDLDNSTKPEESRRLIPDQIRAAGSSTFLDVVGNTVTTRHTTVADFFLRAATSTEQPVDICGDVLCPNCSYRNTSDRVWTLTQKEGQLRMAITIFKHLNSPLFRRRYLPDDPEAQNSEQVVNSLDNVNDSALSPSQENGPTENITSDIQPSAMSITEASSKEHGSDTSQTLESGINDASGPIDSSVLDNDGDAKNADEYFDPAKHSDEEKSTAEQDHLTDDEDEAENEDGSVIGSTVSDSEGFEDHGGIVRPVRYELSYWPHHLQAAEKLWTPEERLTNHEWNELWRLVLKFLCDSPSAFSTWQRHYMMLPESYGAPLNPLQIAAAYGLTGLCEVLIQNGLSAGAETPDGRSALWFAAEHSPDLLQLLLEHGASPNAYKEYATPFHRLLAVNPPLEAVQLMLNHKGDCTLKSAYGMTAIHWFALWGSDADLLRLLVANGGVINATDSYGETGLHKLMWQNPVPLPLLHEFIKSGADVNLSDKESQQPLYEVCLEGSAEGAGILLDHGADIEHADVMGFTALHVAAHYGRLEVIKLLVERKACLTKRDKYLRTAFYLACANNHLESARYLLSAAHDQGLHESIFQAMEDGRTPFSKACGRGHLEIVKMLLAHADVHVDVNSIEGTPKRTALHWASYNARVDIVLLLLENGADATVADANGRTPLKLGGLSWFKDHSLDREPMIIALIEHDRSTAARDTDLMAVAAIRGSANVIERLLDAKAHPSKQDEHGWTPLQLARQYGNTEAAAVLEKRGAVVGSKPNRWVTELTSIRVSEDGRGLEYIGEAAEANPQMILANHPIPAGIERFYFEVGIRPDLGSVQNPFNAIGFATQPARLNKMPGWFNPIAPSWAFHGDDGITFANKDMSTQKYAEPYGKGDTIGCGVIFQNGVDGIIFYTRNGKSLGVAFDKSVRGRLYPAIGMSEPAAITTQWDEDAAGRSFIWAPANAGRFDLEDIKVKGTDESNVTTVMSTKIEPGPGASLAKA